MKGLEAQKQFYIEQVTATMAIEDMPIDEQTCENLVQIAAGEKTAEQIISENELPRSKLRGIEGV